MNKLVVQFTPQDGDERTTILCFYGHSPKEWLEGFKRALFKAQEVLKKEEEQKREWWAKAPKDTGNKIDMHEWLMQTPVVAEYGGTCTEGIFTFDGYDFDVADFTNGEGEIMLPLVEELNDWWEASHLSIGRPPC